VIEKVPYSRFVKYFEPEPKALGFRRDISTDSSWIWPCNMEILEDPMVTIYKENF